MTFTKEECQHMLKAWKDAEYAVAKGGQSYTIDTGDSKRTLTRANISEIQQNIKIWTRRLRRLTKKSHIQYIKPKLECSL